MGSPGTAVLSNSSELGQVGRGESLSRAGQATILDQTIVILSTMVYALGEHWQRSSTIHDGSSHCVRVCGV